MDMQYILQSSGSTSLSQGCTRMWDLQGMDCMGRAEYSGSPQHNPLADMPIVDRLAVHMLVGHRHRQAEDTQRAVEGTQVGDIQQVEIEHMDSQLEESGWAVRC